MTETDVMNKCYQIVQQLDDIIWWCGTIGNPIYEVDDDGNRHPRDLYHIRAGFVHKYNELKDREKNSL